MRRRFVTLALGALSIPALGLAAYGAAHAVSDTPAPQSVIPVSFPVHGGADDPAGHDVNDDRGVDVTTSTTPVPATAPATTPTPVHRGDDGPGHDVGDDHGNDGPGHDVGDDHGNDGPGHDVGDDHGGAATTTPRATTATSGPEHGGSSGRGPGSGRSSGGGSDDGSGHR